jgi:tetratricopeptide (TPR) repeat protein
VWWLAPLSVFLLGAVSTQHATDLARQGDAAFEQEDYAAALDAYQRAEETITDPGLVAFNEGAALYRLGLFRDAEAHYRRALGDAAGERRARVLYDLGNALLQQGQDQDVRLLQQAIGAYQDCLAQPALGRELAEDARGNLALARALLQKARTRKPSQPDSPTDNDPGPSPHEDPRNRQRPGDYATSPPGGNFMGTPTPGSELGPENRQGALQTKQTAPGEGNDRPLPDQEQLAKMSADDTEQYVRQAAARIMRERHELWHRGAATPRPGMKDW